MGFLDLFFPKKCIGCGKLGDYLCHICFLKVSYDVKHICVVCHKKSTTGLTHQVCAKDSLDGAFCAVDYSHVIRRMLSQLTYEPYLSDIAPSLARIMYEGLLEHSVAGRLLYEKDIYLVPMPISKKEIRKRGYNQSFLLAKHLSRLTNIPVIDLLIHSKEPKSTPKEDQKKNIKSVFILNSKIKLENEKKNITILLIADILTTGHSLLEVAGVLKKEGYKRVYGLYLAREQDE